MNNLFKFTIYAFTALGVAWLAFVVGTGQLETYSNRRVSEEDGSVPQDADLFPHALPGIAQQGAKDYLGAWLHDLPYPTSSYGRSWLRRRKRVGQTPLSVARDYILQEHVLIGNTRVGPDLANLGLRGHSLSGFTNISSNRKL